MPRSSLPKLSSIKDGSFEPSRKNPISLRNDEPLDLHLKQLKVGEAATPLELSETELRINGDLFLDGKLKSHKIATDNEYLEIESNTYIRFLSDSSTGHLDLFVTSGTPYYLSSGISQENAKEITKEIKTYNKKIQTTIQGPVVRVAGKKKDELQEIMLLVKEMNKNFPVSFTNFKD